MQGNKLGKCSMIFSQKVAILHSGELMLQIRLIYICVIVTRGSVIQCGNERSKTGEKKLYINRLWFTCLF